MSGQIEYLRKHRSIFKMGAIADYRGYARSDFSLTQKMTLIIYRNNLT